MMTTFQSAVLAVLLLLQYVHASGVLRSTVIVKRGADPSTITSSMEISAFGELEEEQAALNNINECVYDGGMVSFK